MVRRRTGTVGVTGVDGAVAAATAGTDAEVEVAVGCRWAPAVTVAPRVSAQGGGMAGRGR